MGALGTLLNVPIDYYAKVDLGGFVRVVDVLGGVDVNVARAFCDPALRRVRVHPRILDHGRAAPPQRPAGAGVRPRPQGIGRERLHPGGAPAGGDLGDPRCDRPRRLPERSDRPAPGDRPARSRPTSRERSCPTSPSSPARSAASRPIGRWSTIRSFGRASTCGDRSRSRTLTASATLAAAALPDRRISSLPPTSGARRRPAPRRRVAASGRPPAAGRRPRRRPDAEADGHPEAVAGRQRDPEPRRTQPPPGRAEPAGRPRRPHRADRPPASRP